MAVPKNELREPVSACYARHNLNKVKKVAWGILFCIRRGDCRNKCSFTSLFYWQS